MLPKKIVRRIKINKVSFGKCTKFSQKPNKDGEKKWDLTKANTMIQPKQTFF